MSSIERDFSKDFAQKADLEPERSVCRVCFAQAVVKSGGTAEIPPFFRPFIDAASKEVLASAPNHEELKRRQWFVYILKNADGSFYIGMTLDLAVRLQEHQDGQQQATKGKKPKLVYFEGYEGDREFVKERENELIKLNLTEKGRRQIRQVIRDFRTLLRLVDLDA
ncbi:MAG: GIY-YIG nuclease family protein [Chloroflexi bacterium]|nr:GIY-YIG nuclease family protein [Chloroflexota bacterium]